MKNKQKLSIADKAKIVDEEIRKSNHSEVMMINYLYDIIYSLTTSFKYMKFRRDVENFSNALSIDVYIRLTTQRQYLPENDKKYLAPIKSCLNYIKKILKPEVVKYKTKNHIVDYFFEEDYEDAIKYAKCDNKNLYYIDINLFIDTIDRTVMEFVKKSNYAKNELLEYKLYTSCILSLLDNFTLSNKDKNKLVSMTISKNYNKTHSDKRIMYKMEYDRLIYEMLKNNNDIILYDLPEEYENIVEILVRKIKKYISEEILEIKEESDSYSKFVENVVVSNAIKGEK